MTVYLVLYDHEAVEIGKKLFSSMKEYIDDHYVEAKDENYDPHLYETSMGNVSGDTQCCKSAGSFWYDAAPKPAAVPVKAESEEKKKRKKSC